MSDVTATRLMLVDDHAVVRAGIRSMVDGRPDFQVIAEAAHGREALDILTERPVDLVIMDISMPVLDGLEATAELHARFPDIRTLMLTMHASESYVKRALDAGARGYCVKSAPPAEVTDAIAAVARGEAFVSPRTQGQGSVDPRVTRRQLQVLELIALSYTTKEIARELNLSVKTIESHRTALMRVLDLHDLAGIVRYAIRTGVVSPFAQRPESA